ncbi:helix-turn-helix domain-containing protein [Microbacterium sp. NM3R9]|uniref:TetR/AcrR family transcriptional regulator n=1 Tax=Microbacterium thalli TaxID=3027921 RepID=UPI00236522A8|nr:TetR/AcrR family transcriptional regulator [Microbacterium thalli]MDD7928583.1 helix-turn-helix domain containing protein [Microbacterium thalli]MDN8550171.1 helix-turn-helix domain-containing protein [Microbacterium thalli]
MTVTSRTRAPRSDGLRNRQHILDIARGHFAEHGISGSLDAIAKEAGVGPGTLYRHFHSKEALLAALLTARDDEIGVRRDAITRSTSDAGDALAQWLDALIEWASAFDGLPEPLRAALGEIPSPLTSTCEGYVVETDRFLARAQDEGLARADVRGRDLFLMALAISWTRGAAMADGASTSLMPHILRAGWATATAR